MALYQLTMFYPSVREAATQLRDIRKVVEGVAGSNWRMASAGEHTCAIFFDTEVPGADISARLGNFDGVERFQFLLVEVASVQDGFMSRDVWAWLAKYQRKAR